MLTQGNTCKFLLFFLTTFPALAKTSSSNRFDISYELEESTEFISYLREIIPKVYLGLHTSLTSQNIKISAETTAIKLRKGTTSLNAGLEYQERSKKSEFKFIESTNYITEKHQRGNLFLTVFQSFPVQDFDSGHAFITYSYKVFENDQSKINGNPILYSTSSLFIRIGFGTMF